MGACHARSVRGEKRPGPNSVIQLTSEIVRLHHSRPVDAIQPSTLQTNFSSKANLNVNVPQGKGVMADMVNSRIRDRVERARNSSHFALILWTAFTAVAVIVAVYALMVSPGIAPDQALSIFAAP
jgi:hypothetical protein